MKNIKNIITAVGLCLLIAGALSTIVIATAHAATPTQQSQGNACQGLSQVSGDDCGGGEAGINSVASAVVNIISYIAGAIAVIMIIVAGVKYTTSGGDSANVGSAKTTLVYALVGVAVAALAQVLVHLVLNQTNV